MHGFRMRVLALALAATALVGCASSGSGGSRERTSRDVITAEEIATQQVANAYQVVERLRPHFLRPRGPANELVVYVDGLPMGGVSALADVTFARLREIRFLDSREATTRFGGGHRSGAILVVTRR